MWWCWEADSWEAMPDVFAGEIARTAKASVIPSFAKHVKIKNGELGDDAAVLGAAAWIEAACKP